MRKTAKKLFIPHHGNDHKPHFLRNKSISVLLVIALVAEIGILTLFLPILPGKLDYLSAVLPGVLISATNDSRSDDSLNILKESSLLTEAAQLKANDMAEKGYFSHVTPDGKQPWHFVNLSGYDYEVAGENLAVNFVDSKDVHRAWMKSPTHKANILRKDFTEVGIATANGKYKGKDVIFVAQFFARPSLKIAPVVSISEDKIIARVESNSVNKTEESLVRGTSTSDNTVKGVDSGEVLVNHEEIGGVKISFTEKVVSAPKSSLTLILGTILGLVSIALFLKIVIKAKIQYKTLILNGLLIIVVILAILYFNEQLISYFGQISVIS